MRQCLAVRNDHSGGSNVTLMLEMVLDQVSGVATKNYQSPDIVNEMIMLTACKVLRSVISSILYQTWYSIRLMRQETSAIESSWS